MTAKTPPWKKRQGGEDSRSTFYFIFILFYCFPSHRLPCSSHSFSHPPRCSFKQIINNSSTETDTMNTNSFILPCTIIKAAQPEVINFIGSNMSAILSNDCGLMTPRLARNLLEMLFFYSLPLLWNIYFGL